MYSDNNSLQSLNKSKMDSGDSRERSRFIDKFVFYFDCFALYVQYFVMQHNYLMKRFLENFQMGEYFDRVCTQVADRSVLKFVIVVTAASCAFPLFIYILFMVTSVIITLTGFIFIEGTLLVIGGLCMLACILSIFLILSVLGVLIGFSYILALKAVLIFAQFKPAARFMMAIEAAEAEGETDTVSYMSDVTHDD